MFVDQYEHLQYNLQNMHHHYRLLGGWTFAFKDYLDLNVTAFIDDQVMQQLTDIVDPYCEYIN